MARKLTSWNKQNTTRPLTNWNDKRGETSAQTTPTQEPDYALMTMQNPKGMANALNASLGIEIGPDGKARPSYDSDAYGANLEQERNELQARLDTAMKNRASQSVYVGAANKEQTALQEAEFWDVQITDLSRQVQEKDAEISQWRSNMLQNDMTKRLSSMSPEVKTAVDTLADYSEMRGGAPARDLPIRPNVTNASDVGLYYDEATKSYKNIREVFQSLRDTGLSDDDIFLLTEYTIRQRNQTNAAERREDVAAFAAEHPVVSNIASVLASPTQFLGALELANSQSYVSPYAQADPNAGAFMFTDFVQGVRNQTFKDISEGKYGEGLLGSNVNAFLYQTGMSMADSGLLLLTLGPGSVYLMGANAAASSAQNVLQRGGTTEQAIIVGLASGAAEAIFERIGVERLFKLKSSANIKQFLTNMVKQGGVEASEEMLTEVSNILSDSIVMGERSNFMDAVNAYMANGMSEDDARKQAFLDCVGQVGLAGLGGFISGMGFGAGGTVYQNVQQGRADRQTGKEFLDSLGPDTTARQEALEGIIASGLESRQDSESYRLANKAKGWMKQGDSLSDREVGAMIRANEQALNEEIEAIFRNKDTEVYAKRNEDGTVTLPTMEDYDSAKVRRVQMQYAAEMEQKLQQFGIKNVVVTDQLPEGSRGTYVNGTVYLSSKLTTAEAMTETAAHEITHAGQEADANFTKDILAVMDKLDIDTGAQIQAAKDRYTAFFAKNGKTDSIGKVTDKYATEEVVADYIGKLLRSDEALAKFARTDFAGKLQRIVETLAGKVTGRQKHEYTELARRLRTAVAEKTGEDPGEVKQKKAEKNTAEKGGEEKYAIDGGRKITEASAKAALYDALDHADQGNDNMILLGDMPEYIKNISGVDGDLYIFRNHAYENMVSREQAEAEGRVSEQRVQHFHALGIDQMVEAIMALETPLITISDRGSDGNPALSMVLPVFDENDNPIHAVISFYANEPINGERKKRPHVAVTFYGHPTEFAETDGRKAVVDIVNEAVADGKILDYDGKKIRADLPVIAQDASLGNVTVPTLNRNVSQFQKEVKSFKEKNKIRYSIGGENARTADLDALARAKELQKQDVAMDTIYRETGWYTGADGKWRFEMDDSQMKYRPGGDALMRQHNRGYAEYRELELKQLENYGTENWTDADQKRFDYLHEIYRNEPRRLRDRVNDGGATLEDILEHNELFEAYPELRFAKVRFKDLGPWTNGKYNPAENSITLDKALRNRPESTLLHEIQHAIQEAEGFTRGSSATWWERRMKEEGRSWHKNDRRIQAADAEYKRLFNSAPEEFKNKVRAINRATLDQDYDTVMALQDELYESEYADLYSKLEMADFERRGDRGDELTPEELYYNTAGEIEARDAAKRRGMTAEQRRETMPDTGDANTVLTERYSLDADYMDAVERGDMETAQRMVDEAAKAAGYTVKAWHGTPINGITVFDSKKIGTTTDNGIYGRGFYFSTSKATADGYATATGKTMPVYLKVNKPWWAPAHHNIQEVADELGMDESALIRKTYGAGRNKLVAPIDSQSGQFTSHLRGRLYDSVVVQHGTHNYEIVIFDSNAIKSADPVTYDDDGNVIPLSERFNEENDDIRYSVDADYMAAVRRKDSSAMERMVREEARSSFYNTPKLYHGTENMGYTEFDPSKGGGAIYATPSRRAAETYSGKNPRTNLPRWKAPWGKAGKNGIYELYGKTIGKKLVIDAEGHRWSDLRAPELGIRGITSTRAIADAAREQGYKCVIIKNCRHSRDPQAFDQPTDIYIFFDPSQLKSAANVTYDNLGKVIPLSKRFNSSKDDMRYSVDSTGRELSEGQQEYFKDSQIRDEEGRLREVYHGTNSGDFTIFDWSETGRADGGWFGRGFYFTFYKGEARMYGRRIIDAYLNIKKPFVFDEELMRYDGEKVDSVYADSLAFMINFAEKFPELAEGRTLEVVTGWDNEGYGIVKEIPWSELRGEVESVLNDPTFKVQEFVSDYYGNHYSYQMKNGPGKYDYATSRTEYQTREEAEKDRFSAAAEMLFSQVYYHADFHMPHTYIEDIGAEFTEALKKRDYDGVMQTRRGDEVVAFYPEQIKRTDNLNPTEDPDIRYSVDPEAEIEFLDSLTDAPAEEDLSLDEMRQELDQLAALTQETANPIGRQKTDPTTMVDSNMPKTKKGLRETADDAYGFIIRKMVDAGDTVNRVGKAVGDKYLYQFYNMARSSSNAATSMIMDAQTNIRGEKIGKSLNEIFDPIRKKGDEYYNAFQLYLLHMHNIDRMSRRSETTVEIAREQFEQFRRQHPELNGYADYQILDMAEDRDSALYYEAREYAQLIKAMRRAENTRNKPVFGHDVTAEDSRGKADQLLRDHPEFAELAQEVYGYIDGLLQYRVESGLLTPEDVGMLKSVYPHYVPTYRLTEREMSAQALTKSVQVGKTIKRAEGSEANLMPLHTALAKQTMSVVREGSKNRFGQRLLRSGANRNPDAMRHVQNIEEVDATFHEDTFDEIEDSAPKKTNTFIVRADGKLMEIQVSPELFEGIKALSPDAEVQSVVTKFIRSCNNLFKALVTGYNPTFVVRNFTRDLQDAGLYSKDLSEFAKTYPEAVKEIATNGEYWQKFKALGGTYSSIFDYNTGNVERGNLVKRNTIGRIEAVNMAIEQAPRLAEFMATVRNGDGSMENLMEALYNAADVTVNFGRSGTWGKYLNANFVPFLNPGIQGFDKMIRSVTETKGAKNWARLALKAAVFGIAPSLLNALLYSDDDEWDQLKDRDKDVYYLFKIGDGLWLKLPKGRTVSLLGMAADRTVDMIQGEDVDWGGFIQTAAAQVAPANPLESNILKAWIDADLLDKDSPGQTWYGSDIESQRLQNYAPGERYDERTDEVSKWLGGKLDLSPKKINYLLDSYTGVVGDIVLPLLTPRAERDMFTAAFTLDSVNSNRMSEDFYEKLDELTFAKNEPGASGTDQATYRFWNKQAGLVSEVNAAIREIETDAELTNTEKKDLARVQYQIRNELEQNALDKLEAYEAAAAKYYNAAPMAKEEDRIDYAYLMANREVMGAEYALRVYNTDVYNTARSMNAMGIDYEDFFSAYFDMKDAKEGLTGSAASNAERDALMNAQLTEQQKILMYREYISNTRDDDIKAFLDADMSFDQFLSTQSAYAQINEEYDKAKDKATAFSRWVYGQSMTVDQMDVAKEAFTYFNQVPANAERYEEMIDAGMSDEAVTEILSGIDELEPEEGYTSVRDVQKFMSIAHSPVSEQEKEIALEAYMGESAFAKYSEARKAGIDTLTYVEFLDATGDMSSTTNIRGETVTRKEKVMQYIDSLPLSDAKKDALYYAAGYKESTIGEAPWRGGTSGKSTSSRLTNWN